MSQSENLESGNTAPNEQAQNKDQPLNAPGQIIDTPKLIPGATVDTNPNVVQADLIDDEDFDPQDYFDQQNYAEDDPEYFDPEKMSCECCQGYINFCQKMMDPTSLCFTLGNCECCEYDHVDINQGNPVEQPTLQMPDE